MIGHNNGPDIDGQPRQPSIRTRWAKALLEDPTKPVYVTAMAWLIHWYSRHDGTGAAISNQQFAEMCGVSEASCTRGKRWLRDNGYIQLIVGKHHQKTQFRLSFPDQGRQAEYPQYQGHHTDDPQGHHTEGPQPEGPHTDDRRVIRETTLYSKGIQDNKKGSGGDFWKKALNPEPTDDYHVNPEGTVVLVNGVRSRWLLEFGDDPKRLDLALKQISPYIQQNSGRSLQLQVESQLSRIAAERHDRDRRYSDRVANSEPKDTNKARRERMRKISEEVLQQEANRGRK